VINLFVVVALIYVIDTWHQDVFVWFLYEQYGAALLQLYSLNFGYVSGRWGHPFSEDQWDDVLT
jgi:hypothetical protein